MTRVIKVGGRPQADPALGGSLASGWARRTAGIVLVHGGGDEVSTLQAALGGSTKFVERRRVTTREGHRARSHGAVGQREQATRRDAGARAESDAVGLSGEDAALDRGVADGCASTSATSACRPTINVAFLRHLLSGGYLPVISPVSRDGSGDARDRRSTSTATTPRRRSPSRSAPRSCCLSPTSRA